jgi:hypothetical protein
LANATIRGQLMRETDAVADVRNTVRAGVPSS